jgi:hypothetical protein
MIKIPITRVRVEALYNLHTWLIGHFVPDNNHEHLLHAHLVAMYWRLEDMLSRKWCKGVLKVNEPEALAFCQLWCDCNIDHDLYGKITVCKIIEIVDKASKEPKILKSVK